MSRQSVILVSATLLTTLAGNSVANTNPYLERDGRLVVEVEGAAPGGNWSEQNSIYGYTGAGYLVWNGPNNYAKSEAERGNPIQYHFRVSTPGNYELRWRSRNTVGLDATEHNDSWVRFPSGKNIEGEHFLDGWTKAYMGQVAQWTWDAYTVDNDNKPIRQYFDKGDHLIEISGRSNGHGLDRFALFRYEAEDFNTSVFDTIAQSLLLSQAGLSGHEQTGNSCVGNTLSLSASSVKSIGGESDIILNGLEQTALLRFDIPDVVNTVATLNVASKQPSLSLSAYLGSHNDWTASTSSQELPYASALLGTYQSPAATDRVLGIDINNVITANQPVTIVLQSNTGDVQKLHAVSSALEPRLDITVPAEYCVGYQNDRTGTNATAPDNQTPNADSNDDTAGQSPEEAPDTEAKVEQPAIPDTTQPPESQSPFEVVDPRADEQVDVNVEKASKKRGGAMSALGLLSLNIAMMVCLYRRRIR